MCFSSSISLEVKSLHVQSLTVAFGIVYLPNSICSLCLLVLYLLVFSGRSRVFGKGGAKKCLRGSPLRISKWSKFARGLGECPLPHPQDNFEISNLKFCNFLSPSPGSATVVEFNIFIINISEIIFKFENNFVYSMCSRLLTALKLLTSVCFRLTLHRFYYLLNMSHFSRIY